MTRPVFGELPKDGIVDLGYVPGAICQRPHFDREGQHVEARANRVSVDGKVLRLCPGHTADLIEQRRRKALAATARTTPARI